jgi:hypothetical protein
MAAQTVPRRVLIRPVTCAALSKFHFRFLRLSARVSQATQLHRRARGDVQETSLELIIFDG